MPDNEQQGELISAEIVRGRMMHLENMFSRLIRMYAKRTHTEPRGPVEMGDVTAWCTHVMDYDKTPPEKIVTYHVRAFYEFGGEKTLLYGEGPTPKKAAMTLVKNINEAILRG